MQSAQAPLFDAVKETGEDSDYEAFVNKFKPKKTTDDCYTPPAIYEAVKAWVNANVMPLQGVPIVRPFKPGGDYQTENYPPGCVVLDNPPFSILSKIRRFYTGRGIRYFLFGPALTLTGTVVSEDETFIVTSSTITYENGAGVATGFITNLCPGMRIWVAGDLHEALETAQAENSVDKRPPAYDYPDNVVTCARLGKIADRGITLKFATASTHYIKGLEAMKKKKKKKKKAIFGGGFLISERAAAEKAAARTKIIWDLSAREREIIKTLQ